jgi:Domain of unknown function (DUF5666)
MELFISVVGPLGWRYLNYLAYVLLVRIRFAKERRPMNRRHLYLTSFLFLFLAASIGTARAQDAPAQDQTAPPANRGGGRGGPGQGRGTMGKITAISGNSLEVTKQDGSKVTVKLTDATEFRKDRQPAKMADFKVGDMVMVRGAENPDHTVTAEMIGGRSGTGPGGGPGGFGGGGGGAALGEQGKDYVSGEVKSIDPPKLTVLRSDNVTQTLELNEDTSLRRGRDSVTMADIHPGDHVVIRGATANNAFVPKSVMVLSAEQWQRMQQMRQGGGGPAGAAPVAPPSGNPPQQ